MLEDRAYYRLLYIYRTFGSINTFEICVFQEALEHLKVAREMDNLIFKGNFYRGDIIKITQESSLGVIFDLAEDSVINSIKDEEYQIPEKYDLPLLLKYEYRRFLNDTLPYSKNRELVEEKVALRHCNVGVRKTVEENFLIDNIEVPLLTMPIPATFVCKITAKTRINMYSGIYNPFFFLIGSSSTGTEIKIVFWKEQLAQYSSIQVGDFIQVIGYKKKKPQKLPKKLIYNSLHEHIYYNCIEITAKSIFRLNFEKDSDLPDLPIFSSISEDGRKEDNSSGIIKGGIFNKLRGVVEYKSILYKYRIGDQFYEYFNIRLSGGEFVVLFNNSDDQFYDLENKLITLHEMRKVERGNNFTYYLNTIYTQIEIKEEVEEINPLSFESLSVINKRMKYSGCIVGAIGFLPDRYEILDEIIYGNKKAKVDNLEIPVEEFLVPLQINPKTLIRPELSINELKKFFFKDLVISVKKSSFAVEFKKVFVCDKKIQNLYEMEMKSGISILVTENYFTKEDCLINEISSEIIKELTLTPKYFFIDVVRINSIKVIIYLTGLMEIDEFGSSSLIITSEL